MSWSISRIYVSPTQSAQRWLRREKKGFYYLTPPAVFSPLICLASSKIPEQCAGEFAQWSAQASVEDPVEITERFGEPALVPEREELLSLKWLSERLQSPLASYSAETFGGSPEYEYCLEFGSCERLLFWDIDEIVTETEIVKYGFWRRRVRKSHHRHFLAEKRSGCPLTCSATRESFPALNAMLRSLGVAFDDRFRPHMRGFDLGAYWVDPRNEEPVVP